MMHEIAFRILNEKLKDQKKKKKKSYSLSEQFISLLNYKRPLNEAHFEQVRNFGIKIIIFFCFCKVLLCIQCIAIQFKLIRY